MTLREYLNIRGISVARFGRRVGVPVRQTMHKYVIGESLPPREIQERIAVETGALVRPADLEATRTKYLAEQTESAA